MADVDLEFKHPPLSEPADLVFGDSGGGGGGSNAVDLAIVFPAPVFAFYSALPGGVDLVFRQPPLAHPADLVFGLIEAIEGGVNDGARLNLVFPSPLLAVAIDAVAGEPEVDLAIVFPPPTLAAAIALRADVEVQVSIIFPEAKFYSSVEYTLYIANHLRASASIPWQQATPADEQSGDSWGTTELLHADTSIPWRQNAFAQVEHSDAWRQAEPGIDASADAPWRQGTFKSDRAVLPWHQAIQMRQRPFLLAWRQGKANTKGRVFPWRQGKLNQGRKAIGWNIGRPTRRGEHLLPWRQGSRTVSYGGPPILIVVPPADICYTPSGDLVFNALPGLLSLPGIPDLVFYCENHPPEPGGETIVVPTRKVYIVINSAVLIRVSDSMPIPVYGMSMAIDVDSFTYSFSATGRADLYDLLAPDSDGTPVEVQATVNGASYRFLIERLATDRTFGRRDIQLSGRGKNAILDSPYAPILSFANPVDPMTAAQLMDEALKLNGVSLGWEVDFDLEDWLVSAGAWSHQGTHMSAVIAIAAAAGGYVQPDPLDDKLHILPRYPYLPRDWYTDVIPDYELPDAVVAQEGIEWTEKPRYNRVFVSGQNIGRLVQVTIAGTAGDIVPPTVVDALITEVAAGRQRGQSILGDTGRTAMVTLRFPMLPETKWVHPGKFIRYTIDGGPTRVGLVRSSSLQVAMPQVWQTVTVETHE